jgi:hypothetical protein
MLANNTMDNIDTMIYMLKDFSDITFDGFNFSLPDDTIQMISSLSLEVGSPSYVKTPIFRKRENPLKSVSVQNGSVDSFSTNNGFKRKRGNKNMEIVNDEDWEALRSFQTTKIEQKNGIETHIDAIRSYLNKMTDKNYNEMKTKTIELLNSTITENKDNEEIKRISFTIFEIASTNRFYSKIYADLFSELIHKFESMKEIFQESFDNFMCLFNNIEYVDSSVDYDKFCKINKDNEKRKALSTFFINLMNNKIIQKEKIISIIQTLLRQVYEFITMEDKKNEVDELTENIVLLFKKDLFSESDYNAVFVDGMNIVKMIEFLANRKVKDFKSLTNKSIFKFMDMIDM